MARIPKTSRRVAPKNYVNIELGVNPARSAIYAALKIMLISTDYRALSKLGDHYTMSIDGIDMTYRSIMRILFERLNIMYTNAAFEISKVPDGLKILRIR